MPRPSRRPPPKTGKKIKKTNVAAPAPARKVEQDSDALPEGAHALYPTSIVLPAWCDICDGIMWGLLASGYECEDCGLLVHEGCTGEAGERIPLNCPGPEDDDEAEREAALPTGEARVHTPPPVSSSPPVICAWCHMHPGAYRIVRTSDKAFLGVACAGCEGRFREADSRGIEPPPPPAAAGPSKAHPSARGPPKGRRARDGSARPPPAAAKGAKGAGKGEAGEPCSFCKAAPAAVRLFKQNKPAGVACLGCFQNLQEEQGGRGAKEPTGRVGGGRSRVRGPPAVQQDEQWEEEWDSEEDEWESEEGWESEEDDDDSGEFEEEEEEEYEESEDEAARAAHRQRQRRLAPPPARRAPPAAAPPAHRRGPRPPVAARAPARATARAPAPAPAQRRRRAPKHVSFAPRDEVYPVPAPAQPGPPVAAAAAAQPVPPSPTTNTDAFAINEEGNAAFVAGDYLGAARLYARAVRTDSTEPVYHSNLSAARWRLGKFKGSLKAANDCMAQSVAKGIEGEWDKPWYRKARALMALGRLDEADAVLEEGLARVPKSPALRALDDELNEMFEQYD
uniref:Phorbol-ester/DAG-type domain-containing protein n=1 Tax=Sexangularia sp. CB-2014 TaxID=1486929 RepID=A0A7S1VQ95_9EUKA|mmetsp:Transcript_7893/g.25256  ORF Transcript_7893/g.25256 Transcript_7893/m.25256 type:complete len:565 (+) Transcript_7893:92-1786(+)